MLAFYAVGTIWSPTSTIKWYNPALDISQELTEWVSPVFALSMGEGKGRHTKVMYEPGLGYRYSWLLATRTVGSLHWDLILGSEFPWFRLTSSTCRQNIGDNWRRFSKCRVCFTCSSIKSLNACIDLIIRLVMTSKNQYCSFSLFFSFFPRRGIVSMRNSGMKGPSSCQVVFFSPIFNLDDYGSNFSYWS